VTLSCNTPFDDPGVTAEDSCDSSPVVSVQGEVDIATPGVYTLVYSAADASGNLSATVSRTVTVTDNVPPQLTLIGGAELVHECGSPFNDEGVLAQDACEGTIDFTVAGAVDVFTPGVYILTYNAEDSSGNDA